jgi:hypothetical protein
MLVRKNWWGTRPTFVRSRLGWLIVTKRLVIATGTYAIVWEV